MVLAFTRKHQSLPSLRVWVQVSALLTVTAGYALLFVINAGLADAQRRDNHQRFSISLAQQLRIGTSPALPFQMEAAVIMNSQSRNFVVVLRKIICSFWPQTEFVDIHSQENRASRLLKRRPRFFGLVM